MKLCDLGHPSLPREMTSLITGVPAIRSRIRLPCGSGGAARYDPDGRKGTNRLAALIVGGPFDLRDPLRSGPRRRQFDHFALDVEHIAVSHRHHPAQFVDAARRCDRAPAHSMRAKNRRVCAGDFPLADNGTRGKHRVQTHQTVCQEPPAAQAAKAAAGGRGLGRWRHLFIAGTTLDRR